MLTFSQEPRTYEPNTFSKARQHALESFKGSMAFLPQKFQDIKFTEGGYSTAICEPHQCILLPFSKAFSTYGSVISKTFMNDVQSEKNPLHLLPHVMHSDGLFIYVPSGVCIEDFSLVHAIKEHEKNAFTRVHIIVGKDASLQVEERFTVGSALCMTHVTCEIEQGGQLVFNSFAEQNSSLITAYNVFVKEKAVVTLNVAQEAEFSRSSFYGVLQGASSALSYVDFSVVDAKMSSERSSLVEHKAFETVSRKTLKKVISDQGVSRYTGKVIIGEEAISSRTQQMHRALLLGEKGVCQVSPLFDIFQRDTQATHGATIASFDEKMLFYARTRGLSQEEAKMFLIKAFCDDILQNYSDKTRAELEKRRVWIR